MIICYIHITKSYKGAPTDRDPLVTNYTMKSYACQGENSVYLQLICFGRFLVEMNGFFPRLTELL